MSSTRMSSTLLSFRPARDDDWTTMWSIWHEVVAAGDTYAYDPATASDDAKSGWLVPAPDETWLAFDGDTLVGFYHLAPNHGGPGAHIANASYMVDQAVRGKGVGRALVEHSLERGRAAGYRGIQFNAVAASNVWAVKLYLDLGFRTIGTVPGGFRHPEQGYVDLLIMYREI
jgi:GNAT superfamily N-acetyltransferase